MTRKTRRFASKMDGFGWFWRLSYRFSNCLHKIEAATPQIRTNTLMDTEVYQYTNTTSGSPVDLRWISGGSVPTASSVMVCSTWIRGFTSHRNRSKTCYREANFFANCYANWKCWNKLSQIVNTFGSKSKLRPRNMMGFATDAALCRDVFFSNWEVFPQDPQA